VTARSTCSFDGRRVWSFSWSATPARRFHGVRSIAWPGALTKFLDGQTRLTVNEHVSGRVLYDEELSLGTATRRIEIVGRARAPISLDKSGRISRPSTPGPLTTSSPCSRRSDGAGRHRHRRDPASWPTARCSARSGRVVSWATARRNLAYVARPDTRRTWCESFRLQRVIHERGFRTYRYSGAAFRVDVVEGDGVIRGLDASWLHR
jgi:hypothetical protein